MTHKTENGNTVTEKRAHETVKCHSCLEYIGRGDPVAYLNIPEFSKIPFHPDCAKRLFAALRNIGKEES